MDEIEHCHLSETFAISYSRKHKNVLRKIINYKAGKRLQKIVKTPKVNEF